MTGACAVDVGQGPQCACCASTSCRKIGGRASATWHFTKEGRRRRLCDPCWVAGAFGCRSSMPTNERCKPCRRREEARRSADARALGGARSAAQACTAAVPAWSPHGPGLACGPLPPYFAGNHNLMLLPQTNELQYPWNGSCGSSHRMSDAGLPSLHPPVNHAWNGILGFHTAGADSLWRHPSMSQLPCFQQDQPLVGGSTAASSWEGAPNAPIQPATLAGNSQNQEPENEHAQGELCRLEAVQTLLKLQMRSL